jgi:hypothetical protein
MDETESLRRQLVNEINSNAKTREELEALYGTVWDTTQLSENFKAVSFAAPFIYVTRTSDGQKGFLTFQHSPRFYYDFVPAK